MAISFILKGQKEANPQAKRTELKRHASFGVVNILKRKKRLSYTRELVENGVNMQCVLYGRDQDMEFKTTSVDVVMVNISDIPPTRIRRYEYMER